MNLYIENSAKKLIEPIINNLKRQFDEKKELNIINETDEKDAALFIIELEKLEKLINNNQNTNKRKIYTSDETKDESVNDFKIENQLIYLLVDEIIDERVFGYMMKYNIKGIFRKDRLEYEFEEMGKFEKALKEAIRESSVKDLERDKSKKIIYEKHTYKELGKWKFIAPEKDKENFYQKHKYISIFLDPTMKNLSDTIRNIVNDISKIYNVYTADFNEIELFKEKSKKISPDDILKKFTEQFDHLKKPLPSILIEGETGTGKSLIANILADHIVGNSKTPNIYRCALVNMQDNLIDSELFGTREGAFTGAINRNGRIIENAGKMFFLDEIAEIPPESQTKLLLFMDSMRIIPEGYDGAPTPVPAFLIAATNKDLKHEISNGQFRKDLYYRFKYRIKLPSLRERKEDLRFLISFILQNPVINSYSEETKKYDIIGISIKAIEKLESHDYPGNFRELEMILKNAVMNARNEDINIILDRHIEVI